MRFPKDCKLGKVALGRRKCSRYEGMRHIRFEPDAGDKGRLIATNGVALAVVPVVLDSADIGGTIDVRALPVAARGSKKRPGHIRMNSNGSTTTDPHTDVECDWPKPKTTDFPKWRAVVPTSTPTHAVGINPALLWDVVQAIGATDFVVLELREKGEPLVVRPVSDDYERFGVLAPVHIDGQRLFDRDAAVRGCGGFAARLARVRAAAQAFVADAKGDEPFDTDELLNFLEDVVALELVEDE